MNTGKMYIERSGINASYSNMSFYNATGNPGGNFMLFIQILISVITALR